MYRKRHFPIICALFCAVVSIVLGIGIGSVNISPGEIFTAIGVRFFEAQLPEDMPITTVNIITDIRMPRVVLAFLTGAALSASGAAVQSVLRNPLASPYTLGVSSGASFGAGLVIAAGFTFLGQFTLAAAGLMFALLTMFAAVAFTSRIDKNFESSTIVLTGMVLSLFISAMVNIMANLAGENTSRYSNGRQAAFRAVAGAAVQWWRWCP